MKSILENRPALAAEVDKVAEVAGYLWQKGWAERNGGNITVNITEHVDDVIRAMEPVSGRFPIGTTLPRLKGCYFFCNGYQQTYARAGAPPDGERLGNPHSRRLCVVRDHR